MNSKTLMYILKRIALAVLTVWVVITVTFFVMRAVPGGPFLGEKAISEAAQAALEAKYGLDKPLMEQYFTYLSDIFTKFDFGPSLKLRRYEGFCQAGCYGSFHCSGCWCCFGRCCRPPQK